MDLIGKIVSHKKFGDGVITYLEGNILKVSFGDHEKKFIFPDAFRNFLAFKDTTCKSYVEDILKDVDKVIKLEKIEKQLAIDRAQQIDSFASHHNTQAAFGFIDNDYQTVLNTWEVSTGKFLSGASRGTPRIPKKLHLNSACLLTICPDGEPESSRKIFGAFMVNSNFEGSKCTDGIISAHPTYRIALDMNTQPLLFWNYFDIDAVLKNKKWGSVEIKYFPSMVMAKILYDMTQLHHEDCAQEEAQKLFQYFCSENRINPLLFTHPQA